MGFFFCFVLFLVLLGLIWSLSLQQSDDPWLPVYIKKSNCRKLAGTSGCVSGL